MSYDAVTLDTNIFSNNHYDLERGLLAQLSQFKAASVQLVLSEIVYLELRRHLVAATSTKRDRLISFVKELRDSGLFADAATQQISAIARTALAAEDAVARRLEAFIEATNVEIIGAATVSMSGLLSHYFNTSPPFESSGAKKKEFPDAIALLSLESWARDKGLKVLAISKDVGWAAYANTSACIDIEPDLATALSLFQAQHTQARGFIEILLREVNTGRAHVLEREVQTALNEIVPELEVSGVADSHEDFTMGSVSLELAGVKLASHSGNTSFKIVRTGANQIVFTAVATVSVRAQSSATFHGWEDEQGSYDYDTTDLEQDDWFEADVLFELQTSGIFPHISNIELLDTPEEIDFGEIESTTAYFARRD